MTLFHLWILLAMAGHIISIIQILFNPRLSRCHRTSGWCDAAPGVEERNASHSSWEWVVGWKGHLRRRKCAEDFASTADDLIHSSTGLWGEPLFLLGLSPQLGTRFFVMTYNIVHIVCPCPCPGPSTDNSVQKWFIFTLSLSWSYSFPFAAIDA